MQTLFLNLSTSQNRALNQDGITLLRSLTLNQAETYTVNLAFYDGSTPVVPAIGAFSFFLRTTNGTDLIAVDSVTAQSGDYPYYFTFTNDSPSLTNALGNSPFVDLEGVISFTDSGQLDVIEPFTIRVFSTQSTGSAVPYVSTINGLSSGIALSGAGSIAIATNGQTVIISGQSSTGAFYPLAGNPSGFITGIDLSPYATNTALTSAQNGLQTQITTLDGLTGTFYPRTNPSGYLTGAAIPANVVTTTGTQTISGLKTFANLATFPSGATGIFYGDGSHLTGITGLGGGGQTGAVLLTGNQTIVGQKLFTNGLRSDAIYNSAGTEKIDPNGQYLYQGIWKIANITNPGLGLSIPGCWSTNLGLTAISDTSASNASIYIVGIPWGSAQDGDVVTIVSDGNSQDFTFRESASNPNDVQITDGDDNTTGSAFSTAINSVFSGSTANSSWDGTGVLVESNNTGSGESLSASGSIDSISISNSANGTDDSSTGTRVATWSNYPGFTGKQVRITEVSVFVDTTAWSSADIEIGFGSEDDDSFVRALVIPQASLTPGLHLLYVDILPANESDANNFILGADGPLCVREASGGSPANEDGGGNATIYLRGTFF